MIYLRACATLRAAGNAAILAEGRSDRGGGLKLSYAAEGDTDPYVGFKARVVPENITLLPRPTRKRLERAHVVVEKGETVGSILRELGASPEEIKDVHRGARGALERAAKEGRKVRVLTAAAGLGHMRPLRIIIASDSAIEAAAALSDRGTYVPVDIRNVDAEVAEARQDDDGRRRRRRAALSKHLRDRRCATTSRGVIEDWSASIPTTSIFSARCSRATRSTYSTPTTRAAKATAKCVTCR